MDYFSSVSSPPEVPARSPLRNSTVYQNTRVQHSPQPQYEGTAYMDEKHYTALSRKIDDVLETIGSDWPLTLKNETTVDLKHQHDHEDDASSSVYSESLFSDDENHSPATPSDICSRAPSLDATYSVDAPSPTESWSSDTSEHHQDEPWITATEHLRIRSDSSASDCECPQTLPVITTQQMFDIIEGLPRRLDVDSLSVDKSRVEYGVPFSYRKGSSTDSKADDSLQPVRPGSRSRVKRTSSLFKKTPSLKTSAKFGEFSWAIFRLAL